MELLTVAEVQNLLRLPTRKRVYDFAAQGKIPGCVRVGRLLRFNAAILRAWLSGTEPNQPSAETQ